MSLRTPVALIFFSRPDTTARVFAQIAAARPQRLLLIADAARPDRPGERERCEATRALVERIDWPCEVEKNYATENLGCRQRLASGIDWAFQRAEELIVLEDDCLPHPGFFPYCEALLERYRHEPKVVQISGCNLQHGRRRGEASYYFSRYNHVWGWASWRRAWKGYDPAMPDWPSVRESGWLEQWLGDAELVSVWRRIFDDVHAGRIDTWDYQWTYACWRKAGLTALPNVNLISNLGFRPDATHTVANSPYAALPLKPLRWPLRHPEVIERNDAADRYTEYDHHYRSRPPSLRKRLSRWLRGVR